MTHVIAQLEGLKFPDEMVTRFFFKNGLHRRAGRVLELGCGNANNLVLFAAHGWECVGLDLQVELLAQGQRNFKRLGLAPARLDVADLNDALPDCGRIDVLLMPSSLYYVHRSRATSLIHDISAALRPRSWVFCRFRTPADYRHGKGNALGDDCFRLTIDETSERGCINAFYTADGMRDLLRPCDLDPSSIRVMRLAFDNIGRDDRLIANDDIILWGQSHAVQ